MSKYWEGRKFSFDEKKLLLLVIETSVCNSFDQNITVYCFKKWQKKTNFAFSTFMAYKIYPQLMCKVCAFCVVTMRTVENVIMYVDSVCVEGFHVCSDVHCKLCVFYIELQFFTRQSGWFICLRLWTDKAEQMKLITSGYKIYWPDCKATPSFWLTISVCML